MNRQEFIKQGAEILSDETPIEVIINIREAWVLISLLQLAGRHPGLTKQMKGTVKELANQFAARIIERHPKAQKLIDLGWNRFYDI